MKRLLVRAASALIGTSHQKTVRRQMPSKVAEKVPTWLTRILLPEIAEIKGELKNINPRIEATNTRIDSLRNELKADIGRVDSRVEDLDKRFGMAQRLAVVEAKIREREEP